MSDFCCKYLIPSLQFSQDMAQAHADFKLNRYLPLIGGEPDLELATLLEQSAHQRGGAYSPHREFSRRHFNGFLFFNAAADFLDFVVVADHQRLLMIQPERRHAVKIERRKRIAD